MSDGMRVSMHGRDHRPGGMDPVRTGPWHNIGDADEPTYQNGANAAASAEIPNPVPLRFRLVLGPPNILDSSGALVSYTHHQIEIQGDVTGVSPGDVVFTLPLSYRHEHDVPVASHDDNMNYVPCRLYSSGEFVYGVP